MSKIFLGEPPANIKAWIVEHYAPGPGPEPGPTAPDGKALYRTTAGGEWLEDDADITNGTFNGFANKASAVEVAIPSKDASGNDVTSVGDYAFMDCSGLTSVTIPNSVTSIGEYAFDNCRGLTSITIPDTVMSIGNFAFYYCTRLTSVTIPDSVTSIGAWAFSYCNGLTSVTFNSFTKNEVKSMTTNDYIFGDTFYDYDYEYQPMEKSFTAICTDGSMTVHFSANGPATITFTDL